MGHITTLSRVSFIALGAASLAACGGGGGGGGVVTNPPPVGGTPTPTPGGTPTPTPGGTPTPTPGGTPTPTPTGTPTPTPTGTPTPSPTPTPTPTPPATNDDLLGPLASDTFTMQGLSSTVSMPFDEPGTASTSGASGQIAYDSGSDSYTLTVGGDGLTFGPGELSIASSNQNRYEAAGSGIVELADIGKGYENVGGIGQRYVLPVNWVTVEDYGSGADYVVRSMLFGFESDASAVPTSGNASYQLTLMGARNTDQTTGLLLLSGGV
ncbi:hypothetical protein [Alteraurantiacibacter aquimixticola]|uniref:Transferrin-binding protein B C-lobe/N-lobe beta barrel domain-containing protein n=1 Tax=Alteraurantiacibacter aquimixticola TaxID=2489173 RepID=A0A4V4U8K7_9SPHN|nr:hypothetical protein [Alteraurantiacibacter aquimixticola]TIX50393.1 hypothetical protein E5222_08950 [Alteraurantiacibacter aquimixticola]